jgi:hypothetical protein
MTVHRSSPAASALCALALGAAALLSAGPAAAFNPQPDPPARFGIVGLVADQTARLNVVAPPLRARDTLPAPCRVMLNFLDADGVKLIESAQFVLLPGKARHLDLPGQAVADQARNTRLQFLPAVQVQPNLPGESRCAGVAATLELFEPNDGRTRVLIDDPNLYLPD